jgi:hypothetical protein
MHDRARHAGMRVETRDSGVPMHAALGIKYEPAGLRRNNAAVARRAVFPARAHSSR